MDGSGCFRTLTPFSIVDVPRSSGDAIKMSRPSGFTLLELLAVLAISVILLALASVAWSRMLQSARGAKCMANLRQIGMANVAFSQDNDGRIAAGGNWYDYWWFYQLPPYLGGEAGVLENAIPAFICPADPDQGWGNPSVTYPIQRRSYGVNNALRRATSPYDPKRLQQIFSPSKTVYAGDTGRSPADSSWVGGDAYWLNGVPSSRHRGRINYVFLDGHVEGFDVSSLSPGGANQGIFSGE